MDRLQQKLQMTDRKQSKTHDRPRVRAYATGHFEYRERVGATGRVTRFAYGYVFSKHPLPNGLRKHYASGKTKTQAEAAARAKADAHDADWQLRNGVAPRITPTLRQALTERHLHNDQPFTSFKKYRSVVEFACSFQPVEGGRALGDYLLNEIQLHHLEPMYRAWCRNHVGQSQPFMRDMLNGLFKRHLKLRNVTENPAEDLPRAKRRKARKKLEVRDGDLQRLFDAADIRLKAALVLLRRSLRAGEALAITESSIKGNRLTVRYQVNDLWNPDGASSKSVWGLAKLKHDAEEKCFELTQAELDILHESLKLAKATKIYNEVTRKWESHKFVVPNANGHDWHYNDFLLALKELTEKVGVPFRPHDGRRLYATGLMRTESVSPDAIRQSMGHSNLDTTMLYMRSNDEDEARVNDAAGRQVTQAFGLRAD